MIELTAFEPGGTARVDFPLTVGIPFKQGALSPQAPISVLDEKGRARPVQARVMETHPDGSVRWLLLDYQADFTPFRTTRCRLVIGGSAAPLSPGTHITMEEKEGSVLVNTGPLRFEVGANGRPPLQKVWHQGNLVSQGGLDCWVTAEDGHQFWACEDPKATFEIEDSGPLRIAMRWAGTHRDRDGRGHLDFMVRLTAYAGKPFLRIDHIFFNRLDPDVTRVKEIVARLPVSIGSEVSYLVGDRFRPGVRPGPLAVSSDAPVTLEQFELGEWRIVTEPGNLLKEAEPAARGVGKGNARGWVDASGADAGLLLAGKNFWQNYPKAISASPDAFRCFLIPDRGEPFPIPRGMAKSHTFYLYFHGGKRETADRADLAFMVQRWPMPAAPADHYLESGEMWDFFSYYPKNYPRLEYMLRELFESDRHEGPEKTNFGRAYGLKHYGDFIARADGPPYDPDAPTSYYMNNECDTAHVLFMMFLRSQEIVKWWGAEAHALHMMDVDTCYHAVPLPTLENQDPKILLNSQYRHCYQHVGNIQTPGAMPVEPAFSHTFAEGLIDYYHLTGDRRALEVAVGYAKSIAYKTNRYDRYQWGAGREAGWALLVLAAAYRIQPNEEIRQAADIMISNVISEQQPDGGILDSNVHRMAYEERKVVLYTRGVARWHQVTGDEKSKQLFLSLMEFYLRVGFSPEGTPLSSTWPEGQQVSSRNQGQANLESLAYAYTLTGDRRYIEAGMPVLCQDLEWMLAALVDSGPTFNSQQHIGLDLKFAEILRGTFPFMQRAHELGLLQKVPELGAWLAQ